MCSIAADHRNRDRRVLPGNLFVCVEGAHADGHHFIPHAITEGANLILAKLMIPGAELALYTDADPSKPELSDLYQEPFYQMAENDTIVMETCSDEMAKVYDKMQGFAMENGLDEEETEKIQMAGAMRCISSALNYDFSHWYELDGAAHSLPAWLQPCHLYAGTICNMRRSKCLRAECCCI
jgi:hypothetical protein